MGRRKKHAEEHVNLERWLVSYADFITLLFATFVILYALSQLDLAKFKDLKDSLKKAFAKSPTVLEGDAGVLNTSGQSVLESGGYAPTVGIVGAVLGLIQVMENLSEPSKLGAGIAVAFVATVYGLIGANLFFIPFSTRIKLKDQKGFLAKEMMVEGILAIQAGESPALIERKLQSYILEKEAGVAGASSKEAAA